MARQKEAGRYIYSASLAGLMLLLLVGLAHGFGLLTGWLMSWAGADTAVGDAQRGLEWLSGLLNLCAVLGTFIPPLGFALKGGKRAGLKLPMNKGTLPVAVLLPLFLGAMLALNAVSSLLRGLIGALAGLPPVENAALPATPAGRIFYFLASCAAAALLEELVFRGAIQGLLRRWGPRFAILSTSVLFMLMHASLWELPAIFALSLLLGYIAEVSGSVLPCVVLHFSNNAFVFVLRLAGDWLEPMAAMAFVLWLVLVFFLMFGGAVWAVRTMKLGSKLRLGRDTCPLGSVPRRLKRLFTAPFFVAGLVVLAVNFVLRLLGI